MSSVDARRSCASRLALTGGVVVAEIDGVAKEGSQARRHRGDGPPAERGGGRSARRPVVDSER